MPNAVCCAAALDWLVMKCSRETHVSFKLCSILPVG